jgi:maleate cis-trans isomerase
MTTRQRIGVMVPSTNTTCEADFQLVVPRTFTVHGQRLWLTKDALGEDGKNRMTGEIESGARYLATARVDAISYGCTTGSFFKGPGWDREMIALIRRRPVSAATACPWWRRPSLRRPAHLGGDFPEWNNQRLRAYLAAQGFEVLNLEAEPEAARAGNQGINDQDPARIVEFASRACRPEADALLCSCTAWRSVEAVEEIERRTGKPVVTSNQASIWMTLHRLGHHAPIAGFGRLLRELVPNIAESARARL